MKEKKFFKTDIQSVPKIQPKEEPVIIRFEPADPPDAVIQTGTQCTRNGCNKVFRGDQSRTEECSFHPGYPLFHEGSKGWTCCKPKTLLFDEFLNLEGCMSDRHKFIPSVKKEVDVVTCRSNWYQSDSAVIIDFYAKKVDKQNSEIEFFPDRMRVKLTFDGKIFQEDFILSNNINPSTSTYQILSVKVEVTLRKAEHGVHWIDDWKRK